MLVSYHLQIFLNLYVTKKLSRFLLLTVNRGLGAFSTLNSIGSLQDLPQYLKSHSLSFFVTLCHSLSLVAPHVVLSLVVIREMLWPYLAQFYADKNCTKISCEYSAIKRWLRCRDILRIQKISDALLKKFEGS